MFWFASTNLFASDGGQPFGDFLHDDQQSATPFGVRVSTQFQAAEKGALILEVTLQRMQRQRQSQFERRFYPPVPELDLARLPENANASSKAWIASIPKMR